MIEQRLKGIPVIYGLARGLRGAIRRAVGAFRLKRALARTDARRIVIGASGRFEEGWLPTEIETLNLLKPRDWDRFFRPDSLDVVLAEHVWEHLSVEEGIVAAKICYRYLKPGGHLRVAVPDGLHPDPAYIGWVRIGGIGPDSDSHRVLYTYTTLRDVLSAAGFDVRLYEYYDEEGQFHFHDWDTADGMVRRSSRFETVRPTHRLKYTSIVADGVKPAPTSDGGTA